MGTARLKSRTAQFAGQAVENGILNGRLMLHRAKFLSAEPVILVPVVGVQFR